MNEEFRQKFVDHVYKFAAEYEHDPVFIIKSFDTIVHDAEALRENVYPDQDFFLVFGICWHWRRPHQMRWAEAGGFAWPAGYKNIPDLDSSFRFAWINEEKRWYRATKEYRIRKRDVVLRVVIPAHTLRHTSAAVHTILAHGVAESSGQGLLEFYGFRKLKGQWECTHTTDWKKRGWHRLLEPSELGN